MSARKAGWPWSALGLDSSKPTLREVKSAYAKRLKEIDHNDPDQFQPLQQAFTAAKARAKAAEGPRKQQPRMAQIMAEKGAPAPLPTPAKHPERQQQKPEPEPTPAPKPDPAPQTNPEPAPKATPKPQPAATQNPGPEPQQTEQPARKRKPAPDGPSPWPSKSRPAPEPAPPPPPPPSPLPNTGKPWGASSDDLNALYSSDPWAAEQAYFAKLERVLAWPVQLVSLSRMLDLEMLHDPAIKRRTEGRIFNTIAENVTDFSTPMPPGLAALLEEHFQWSTDGVGLSRRFGMSPAFQRVVHCYSATRPSQGTSTFDLDKRPWLAMKLGLWMLVTLFVFSKMADNLDIATVIVATIVALGFAVVTRGVLILVSIPVMLVPGLVAFSLRTARKIAPNLVADMGRSKDMRGFALWVVSALLVMLMFIL